jgi:hypothetical protein
MDIGTRDELLGRLAEAVGSVEVGHTTRVALRFRQAAYDHATDSAVSAPVTTAPADAVLLFDGVFLLGPELIDRWDLRIRHRGRATAPQPLHTRPTVVPRGGPPDRSRRHRRAQRRSRAAGVGGASPLMESGSSIGR